jgi:hypothetical protein
VVPEEAAGEWKTLSTPEALVEFYDPTDVFGDLAEALAEAYPSVAAGAADDEDDDDDDEDEDGVTTVEGTGEAAEDEDDGKGPLRTGDSLGG